jgi:hypothetical protein
VLLSPPFPCCAPPSSSPPLLGCRCESSGPWRILCEWLRHLTSVVMMVGMALQVGGCGYVVNTCLSYDRASKAFSGCGLEAATAYCKVRPSVNRD